MPKGAACYQTSLAACLWPEVIVQASIQAEKVRFDTNGIVNHLKCGARAEIMVLWAWHSLVLVTSDRHGPPQDLCFVTNTCGQVDSKSYFTVRSLEEYKRGLNGH